MTELTTDIDLTRPEFWQGDPFPTLRALREQERPYWHDASVQPFWALTRYDDIVHVSKHPEVFSSAHGLALNEQPGSDQTAIVNMVTLDDPMHKWLRALVSTGFTPGRIRALEPHIRNLTTSILDDVSGKDVVDFVDEIAAPLPSAVIGEMLGVPREDHHLIRKWSDSMVETSDDSPADDSAMMEMPAYLAAMQAERMERPTDDLVSLLLHAEVDGRGLEQYEQIGFFVLLEFAGNETTRNTISGGILAMSDFPDQWQRLLDDRSLIQSAVEESLRYASPVIHFVRTAMSESEIRGQEIREGEKLAMFYGAGNRDPDVFSNPDAFDVSRTPNAHVAFGGGGPHFCLGAALGRLEVRVMFEELLRRYPDLEVVGPPERARSNFVRGISSFPVRLGRDRG